MRTFLVVPLLLVLTAIGGCVEDPGTAEATDTTDATPTTSSTSGNNTTRPGNPTGTNGITGNNTTANQTAPNEPPTANLTHDLVNDTVAVNVTFNFTVGGNDTDGGNLTWELDVDGDNMSDYNGTDAEFGNVSHNYTENGTYNVTLVVSDGVDNATANATINVTAGGGQTFEDTVDLPCRQCSSVDYGLATGFGDILEFEVTPNLTGLPFTATSTGGDPDMVFLAEDCGGDMIEEFMEDGPEGGVVPEEAACILIWEFFEFDSTITVVVGGAPPPEEEEEP